MEQEKTKPRRIYHEVNVVPSTEEGFDIETGFDELYHASKDENDTKGLDYYFRSYSSVGIHEEMLRDKQRTNAYREAILRNKHLFRGKTVLDVGCGTGILSLFAAAAGAKKVFAVDMASITNQAKQNIEENGYSDVIEVINGKIEELTLPVDTVDIIISEWMGYCLIYESMMDSVLYARDKWLRKDGKGMIFPDKAIIYLASIDDRDFVDEKTSFWEDVYGIKMDNMIPKVMREGFVDEMSKEVINSVTQKIAEFDLHTVTIEELDFASDFDIKITRYDNTNGFIVWFDTDFTLGNEVVSLRTSPYDPYTHWKQTLFYMDSDFTTKKEDRMKGYFGLRKNQNNPRHIDIVISAEHIPCDGRKLRTTKETKVFEMQ